MLIDSFTCRPDECQNKETYVDVYKEPSIQETAHVLKEYDSARFGIVGEDLWLWRGDVFHGTVMRHLWELKEYREWLDWDEALYFERHGDGIVWSTKPEFDANKNKDMIKAMQCAYPRMKAIRSGTTVS